MPAFGRRLRIALWVAAAVNLFGLGIFGAEALGHHVALIPLAIPSFYAAQLAWIIGLFGGAYAWLAHQAEPSRPLLFLGGLGKLGFFALFVAFWLADAFPFATVATALPDLVLGLIFVTAARNGAGHSPEAVSSAKLASITPFFIVADLQRSTSYYVDRLGFEREFQGPPDDVYYAQVRRDGIAVMLKAISPEIAPCPNHTRHAWARWDAYVYTPDPDVLFEEFKGRGASFVKQLSFIDDGLWGFEVADADGYVLAFFCLRNA